MEIFGGSFILEVVHMMLFSTKPAVAHIGGVQGEGIIPAPLSWVDVDCEGRSGRVVSAPEHDR